MDESLHSSGSREEDENTSNTNYVDTLKEENGTFMELKEKEVAGKKESEDLDDLDNPTFLLEENVINKKVQNVEVEKSPLETHKTSAPVILEDEVIEEKVQGIDAENMNGQLAEPHNSSTPVDEDDGVLETQRHQGEGIDIEKPAMLSLQQPTQIQHSNPHHLSQPITSQPRSNSGSSFNFYIDRHTLRQTQDLDYSCCCVCCSNDSDNSSQCPQDPEQDCSGDCDGCDCGPAPCLPGCEQPYAGCCSSNCDPTPCCPPGCDLNCCDGCESCDCSCLDVGSCDCDCDNDGDCDGDDVMCCLGVIFLPCALLAAADD